MSDAVAPDPTVTEPAVDPAPAPADPSAPAPVPEPAPTPEPAPADAPADAPVDSTGQPAPPSAVREDGTVDANLVDEAKAAEADKAKPDHILDLPELGGEQASGPSPVEELDIQEGQTVIHDVTGEAHVIGTPVTDVAVTHTLDEIGQSTAVATPLGLVQVGLDRAAGGRTAVTVRVVTDHPDFVANSDVVVLHDRG